jgi:hypothetical protein
VAGDSPVCARAVRCAHGLCALSFCFALLAHVGWARGPADEGQLAHTTQCRHHVYPGCHALWLNQLAGTNLECGSERAWRPS